MCRKIFLAIGKIILSGVIAFVVLTIFCCFYYNIPVHYNAEDGATDYKWNPNTFYSRGTEGFAIGKTNNDGYINTFDYSKNMRVDVLIMGSSHMEGYQVDMKQSTAGRLNLLLQDNTVYNIGISGHNFLICANNLEAAIKKYHPSKYVVIETDTINFQDEELAHAIEGSTAEISIHTNGLAKLLSQNPYLRLIYGQIENYQRRDTREIIDAEDVACAVNIEQVKSNEELMDKLLKKMSLTAEASGIKMIIVYHPGIQIDYDGTIHLMDNQRAVQQAEKICSSYGIYFLDMSERFKKEYYNNYQLPYGFANSSVGTGHLNKYGHEMIADELYKLIVEESVK